VIEKREFSSQRTGNKFHMDHMHSESIFSCSKEDWSECGCNKSYNKVCYKLRPVIGQQINARIKQATTRRITMVIQTKISNGEHMAKAAQQQLQSTCNLDTNEI
jgi:hypothetical protein